MAVLPDEDRRRIWAHFMRQATSIIGFLIGVNKNDLRAAFNAIDDFLEANAAALNTAIPQPARTNLTVIQKAIIVGFVAFRRAGLLKTAED